MLALPFGNYSRSIRSEVTMSLLSTSWPVPASTFLYPDAIAGLRV